LSAASRLDGSETTSIVLAATGSTAVGSALVFAGAGSTA
jgi:hypothetical protein